MDCFLNPLDIFHIYIGEGNLAIENFGGMGVGLEGDWTNLLSVTFKAGPLDFFTAC